MIERDKIAGIRKASLVAQVVRMAVAMVVALAETVPAGPIQVEQGVLPNRRT